MTDRFPFDPTDLYRSLIGLVTPLGLQASGGELYRGAIFGRDSLRVGLDLVEWFPALSETILLSLATFQSTARNEVADATGPGQIPHEIRSRFVGPREVNGSPAAILAELSPRWGGTDDLLVYYGSVDATLQFIRLIHRHARLHGTDLLDIRFRHHQGTIHTLRDALAAAAHWTASMVTQVDPPLMGFERLNRKHGHRWQILQDGATSILHADGSLANGDARVETIGLQGLAWDALNAAADLLGDELPEEATIWRDLALRLRAETLARFWLPEEQYFLTGFDRDPHTGLPRPIAALTAIPVELLETSLFDDLQTSDRDRYLQGIVAMASGPEFMTSAGIRSRALRHADLLDYPDYHGVFTCWGVTNSVYAAGLRRQGCHDQANAIVSRHLGMLAGTGALHEFMYVDRLGDVAWPLLPPGTAEVPAVVLGTNYPEINQAWTLSFALRELLTTHPTPLIFPEPTDVACHLHPARLDQAEARDRETASMHRMTGQD